ncbi:MAG TPA: TIGR02281 family clan AA aspartic protease [Sphingomicrobium sp.]
MSDRAPDVAYYAIAVLLVLSSLFTMKLPLGKALRIAAAWVAIFAGFFILFAFRGDFLAFGQRLKAEAVGSAIVDRQQVRIPIADDGHFWVEAAVNGHSARFLVDSGASVTTISREMARAAGIPDTGQHIVVDTANGRAPATEAYADRLEVRSITRIDFPIDINGRDQTNVLGMNFLSSLSGWRVEGNYLVLQP